MSDIAPPPPARSSALHVLSFAWGLAGATVFFIVPDVLLTRVAVNDFRRAVIASLWAVIGALVGGTMLWCAAHHGSTQFLLNTFDWIPGISRELIIRTAQSLDAHGLTALVSGALSGQPYKLYAVHAGAQNFALGTFLSISALARISRFLLTSIVAALISRALRHLSLETRHRLHAYIWFVFYTAYFVLMRERF